MTAGVDLLELVDVDLGVDGGRLQLFVTKQLLDVPDVRAAFEQVRGARVTEQMAADAFPLDARLPDVAWNVSAKHFFVERLAVAGQEERLLRRIHGEQRSHVLDVLLDPRQGALTHGDDAVLAALAQSHPEDALLAVEVGPV